MKDIKHNSLHLGQKYAWIFVLGHHLFLEAHSFPLSTFSGGGNLNKNFPEIEMPGACKGEMLKLRFERYIILCFGVLDVPLCDVIKLKFNLLSFFLSCGWCSCSCCSVRGGSVWSGDREMHGNNGGNQQ